MKSLLIPGLAFSFLLWVNCPVRPGENPTAAGENAAAVKIGDKVTLSPPPAKGHLSLEESLWLRRSIRSFTDQPLTWDQIGRLLWAAQGVNRPGTGGRTSPSAGATYPLETYVVLPDGVYKYLPPEHAAQKVVSGEMRQILREAGLGSDSAQPSPCVLIFTAVFERTVAKFGKDAYPYVYLEAGHAAQNVLLEAAALGLGAVPNGSILGYGSKKPLGLPRGEDVVYILIIGYPKAEN
ncbi:MAG: SagB/ThcOx family dehydrogenase [bacterium]